MARYFTREAIPDEGKLIESIDKQSHVLLKKADLSSLFKKIADARIVMLGEASH